MPSDGTSDIARISSEILRIPERIKRNTLKLYEIGVRWINKFPEYLEFNKNHKILKKSKAIKRILRNSCELLGLAKNSYEFLSIPTNSYEFIRIPKKS